MPRLFRRRGFSLYGSRACRPLAAIRRLLRALTSCYPRRPILTHSERAPPPCGLGNMSDVGYYDMTAGQGGTYQADEVTANGHTAIQVTSLAPASLAQLDTLYVTNPDNSSFAASYLASRSDIETAVAGGMNLMIFDRCVTNAQSILPGGSRLTLVRSFTNDANIDLAAGAPSWFSNGPAGPIDGRMFDGGNSSSHGYVNLATLPTGAVPLLTNGDPNQVVAFVYPYGNGHVFYSTIPLDYYSRGSGFAFTTAEIQTLFGNLQYGMDLSCPICFARQTLIATPSGVRPIESLQAGDLIVVQGAAPCPIRWIGSTRAGPQDLHHLPGLRPVRIKAGALGAGLPLRDLVVSRQHRLLWPPTAPPDSARLVAAIHLTGLPGIAIDETVSGVEYFHILLDHHHLLFAEGVMAESLHLGPQALRSLTRHARQEMARLCPDVLASGRSATARPVAGRAWCRTERRHAVAQPC